MSSKELLQVEHNVGTIVVENKNVQAIINTATGYLESYKYKGLQLIDNPLVLNFWRAETENEKPIESR